MPIAQSATADADVGRASRFLTVSLARELGILLSLSLLFPFMIHIIPVPEDAQLGPKLLPMFYAPLLAVLWGRLQSALGVALLAPWLNWVLTSHPSPPSAVVMMIQLLGFVVVLRLLLNRVGARWFLAAPAYLSGIVASLAVAIVFPALIHGRGALVWALQSVTVGLPGIAILVLINWLVLRFYPPSAGGGGPQAA